MAKRRKLELRQTAVRGPGRPATGKNTMIAIRWQKPLLDGIDTYAKREKLEGGRPTALRQIVLKFLVSQGITIDAAGLV